MLICRLPVHAFNLVANIWSDTDATSESMDSEGHRASYGVVKPELQKVVFFM
jgi:hypothetical protein